MLYLLVLAGILVCALEAIRAPRLLVSALWLAGASAITSLLMYQLGAPEVAVIELSVGAGLVTVIFVFAINIAGEEPSIPTTPLVPRPVAWAAILACMGLLAWLAFPVIHVALPAAGQTEPFAKVLWETRTLDVLLQVALIFAGVLGVLGLLSPAVAGKEKH